MLIPARGLLFDNDGTLVDSHAASQEAWNRWCLEFDSQIDLDEPGISGQRAQDLVRERVIEAKFEQANNRINELEQETAYRTVALPGAKELLAALDPEVWTVVTSANSNLGRARLSAAGLPIPPTIVTATDVVLTITEMLRKHGVVGKFVEFYGSGVSKVPLANRATIGNMGPEYGATCGFFPVDGETINYLTMSGRTKDRIALVESYSKAQGMWRDSDGSDLVFTDTLELDLSSGEGVHLLLAAAERPVDLLLANAGRGLGHAEARAGDPGRERAQPAFALGGAGQGGLAQQTCGGANGHVQRLAHFESELL